jgi:DNA repair protein RecO (recombination protein O)
MGYVKTKGIVIREVNTGEADKIVTIFSNSHGKISGYAKGARRSKSKFVAGVQFLTYSDFVLYKGKDLYSIFSSDVIETFYEIRNDIKKLTYVAHMVEILNDVVQEEQPSTKVLKLFLNTLHMLDKTDKSPELLTRIFELRVLSILGYAPSVKCCTSCGNEQLDNVLFSFKKCGFLCGECKTLDMHAIRISLGAAKAIRHIVKVKLTELFCFDLSAEVLNELGRITRRYLKDRLDRDYKKLEFLNSLDIF